MTPKDLVLSFAGYVAQILPQSVIRALYRNPLLSKLIRESLNRAAPDGLSEVKVAAGSAEGMLMLLDLKTEKDYWLGTYEPELQGAIINLVNPGDIIYDIGANIGFMTLLFANRTGPLGHVYAFEALPLNTDRLSQNITINGFQDRVTIIQAAVLNQSGDTEFLIGPSTGMGKVTGSAGRSSLEYQEAIQVKGLSIDDFVGNSGNPLPNIIKIDIEGGEILALPGMVNLLSDHRPVLMVELHGHEAARVAWDLLTQEQYRICRMAPNYPQINQVQDLDWKSYLVAFPND
jgi:FkbM family methyltransferase